MVTMGDKVTKAAFSFNQIVSAGKAVIGALQGVYDAALDTIASLDDIDKGSQRMGVAAEYYQELAYAAELCGVEMSTMEKAAKKLEGTDMTIEDALNEIMSLATAEERSAKAAELFGDSIAYTLSPLLNVGAEGFQQMRQEANDLGIVMSQDVVNAGATANDAITKVNETIDGLKTSLLVELLPYITEFADWMVAEGIPFIKDEAIPSIKNELVPALKEIISVMEDIFYYTDKAVGGLKRFWTAYENSRNTRSPLANGLLGPIGTLTDVIEGVANIGGNSGHFANGGVVSSPTVSLIGEAGPEMVMPLTDNGSPYSVYNIFGGQNELLSAIANKLDNMKIVLDSGVVAGAVNTRLAKTKMMEGRGL